MSKDYQKKTASTSTTEVSPRPVSVPDVVSVAMSEIAADVREGLLALAVGAGLQVMAAMMAADVDALCGPRGRHDPTGPSRRFIKATEHALTDLMSADLSSLDLVAFMVDGVHFGEHVCVVALGITIDGVKVPLAIEEGSTENTTLATTLIVGLQERGLDVTRPILAVLDGSKALARAVEDVFDHPVIARCQQHKIRNVRDRLPDKLRSVVERRMRAAYHAESALAAQAQLEALAAELDRTHPGAASSLREGLEETLTVLRLGVPPTLARSLRSTNPIESMIEICREHAKNVKNWRDGQMALRWAAAVMIEAGKQFRRVNGHLHLPALRAALEADDRQTVGPMPHDEDINDEDINAA